MAPRVIALLGLLCSVCGYATGASPANADPLCYGVSTSGTVIGTQSVGPVCEPTPFGTICETETAGLDPSALVTEQACVVRP